MENLAAKDPSATEDTDSVQTPPHTSFSNKTIIAFAIGFVICAITLLALIRDTDEITPPDSNGRLGPSEQVYQGSTSVTLNLSDICLGFGMTPTTWAFVVDGESNTITYAVGNFKVDRVARIDERIFITLSGDAVAQSSESTNILSSSLRFSFGFDFSRGLIRPTDVELDRFRVYDPSNTVPIIGRDTEIAIESSVSDIITNLSYKAPLPDNCEVKSIRFMTDDTVSISFREVSHK